MRNTLLLATAALAAGIAVASAQTMPGGGQSGGAQPGAGGGGGGTASISLSPEQVRQVQIMLNEKGFNVGEPDGVLGLRMRQALIAFQQRHGLQVTGQIDQRTVAALGVNIQQGGQSQPSTTGQGNDRMQSQPPANQGPQAPQNNQRGDDGPAR
jgi:peptidoglycan hydrolase-like protein with peptidoglycan-binding domain